MVHPVAMWLGVALATPRLLDHNHATEYETRTMVISEPLHHDELCSTHQILSRIYPPAVESLWPNPRAAVVQRAAINYAKSLNNTVDGRWAPLEEPFKSHASTIEPLIRHPFWEKLKILATALPLRHQRLPVGTSADLFVRFLDGGDVGIGMVQVGTPDRLNPERVAAELGAALALLSDTYRLWPRRAFVLFCATDRTTVELINVDAALSCWIDALYVYKSLYTFNTQGALL